MHKLWCDLETFSPTPIRYGSHRYAETAEVLLWGYAVDDGPAKVWDLTAGDAMPADLKEALEWVKRGECYTVWHNGMNFDTVVLKAALGIDIPPSLVIDTMVIAYEHGLSGKLGDLTHVIFNMSDDDAKDMDGARLVQMFCTPRPETYKLQRYTRETHPKEWKRFVEYCRQDIVAMRELYALLPKWNISKWERRLQVLDAEINRRGIQIDTELAEAALQTAERNKKNLAKKTLNATDGEVESATQRDALKQYIEKQYGFELQDMTKAHLEHLAANPETPEPVRDLLKLRLSTAKTSISKFKAILNHINKDGRLRGTLQFRGAFRTGRFAGRGPQFQNLARPTIKDADEIEAAVSAVKMGWADWFYDDIADLLSNCLRGEIIAGEGKKLVVADFSNIEGRVLAWLAGEQWKLKAFRDYDEGKGHDLYKLTYGRTFNVDPDKVTKAQRQMGKVLELALGYGGGAGAFATFARTFGIDLHDMAKEVRREIDPMIWAEAEHAYTTYFVPNGKTEGMDAEVFIACDAVKRAWRKANSAIVSFWGAMGKAIEGSGRGLTTCAGRYISVDRNGNYLRIRLPSGRYLVYPGFGMDRDGIYYQGMIAFTRKWGKIRSYPSKFVENVTQAVACDVLCEAMLRLDAAGFEIVLTVHDEVIAEAPRNSRKLSLSLMSKLMSETPSWAEGLPLSVAGYEAERYRKD